MNYEIVYECEIGIIYSTGVVLMVYIYVDDRPSFIYMDNHDNRDRAIDKIKEYK